MNGKEMIDEEMAMKVGDVIEDFYGNPAVVLGTINGAPRNIMQTVGSDRGNVTYPPSLIVQITDETRVAWARNVAREQWVKKGLKRSDFSNS